jgi:molybdopterin converting factor subunit 1
LGGEIEASSPIIDLQNVTNLKISVYRMKLKLLLFAKAREIVGSTEVSVEIEGESITHQALLDHITTVAFPALKPIISSCILAINQEYSIDNNNIIREGDEVALIPPISGG